MQQMLENQDKISSVFYSLKRVGMFHSRDSPIFGTGFHTWAVQQHQDGHRVFKDKGYEFCCFLNDRNPQVTKTLLLSPWSTQSFPSVSGY